MGSDSHPQGPELSLSRKLVFSAVALVLVLGLLELVLAIAGVDPTRATEDPFVGFVGSDPLFERTDDAQGIPVFVTAPSKRGYFNPQSFPAAKAPGTLRVFCLGGSTTYGRPYADPTSFAGWLRELLQVAEPGRPHEVINAGGISYASYRVARIVEEVLADDPDVLVVYTGHNEFLEERTYGEVRDRNRLVQLALDAVTRTRIGAVAAGLVARDGDVGDGRTMLPSEVQATLDHSAGLDLYERDDELAADVERHYRLTLERIADLAAACGVGVVFVTPASNLAGFSPFKSEISGSLSPEERARVRSLVGDSGEALEQGRVSDAVESARAAVSLDPRCADAQYALGRAEQAAGRYDRAQAAFVAARDEDVCTLRAPSRFVQIVREVARDRGVTLVDYVARLREAAVDREGTPLVGDNFFLDHVHPTIEGHELLANRLVEVFAEQGWIALDPRYPGIRPAVVARVNAAVTAEEHARALANLALTLSWAGKSEDSRRLAERALESGVEDPTILLMAARHAAIEGEPDTAYGYYQRAIAAEPNNAVARSQMGFFLMGSGRIEAAVAQFHLASLMWDGNETYQQQLGFALEKLGRPDLALAAFERASQLAPQDAQIAARVHELRTRVPSPVRFGDLVPQVTRHASGYPSTLAVTRDLGAGQRVPDGFRVTWYDTGELESFEQLRDGRPTGDRVRWDRQGREIERTAIR